METKISKIELTKNARLVLNHRYLRKDHHGAVVENPEQLFDRVASVVAAAEKNFGAADNVVTHWHNVFYNLMASMRFLPNSPTLMNAGRSMGMLSACFVLPLPDSIEGIFDTVKSTALIQKAGGGTGFSFDQLRPTGDYIASSGGKTSGPMSFWKVLSQTTESIQQGAFRRGANMAMMSITHPDILKFIHAKENLQAFVNYNISVKIPDDWMNEMMADGSSPQVVQNPRTGLNYYLLRSLEISSYELADLVEVDHCPTWDKNVFWTKGQLWQAIIENAQRTGEPGVAFIDRINRDNPTPALGRIEATNPCGEQPLLPYEACNLGSINLARFVQEKTGKDFTIPDLGDETELLRQVDWQGLAGTIHEAVRFLDNVIDVNNYQIEPIKKICRANRKIGLGVMGFADALCKLAVPYDSEAGLDIGGRFMHFIQEQAHQASQELANERGVFPNWKGSIWDNRYHRPQRNAAVTTVAPTGTLSIIANCSGGIEPLYWLSFTRQVLSGSHLPEINSFFRSVAQDRGIYTDELYMLLAKMGSLEEIDEIPEDIRRIFICAHDISPEWHVRMQARFQQYCDASISKTINMPATATAEQVNQVYQLAYQLGCKGITVYRDGCRHCQPMACEEKSGDME